MKKKKYNYTCRMLNSIWVCDTPQIDVILSNKGKLVPVKALIDSGCGITNIDLALAKLLDVDLNKAKRLEIRGVSGTKIGLLSSVDMEINKLGKSFNTPAIFVNNLPFPVLLGQNNFFEKFEVKFEKYKDTFDLKRVKT
jgi:hypothetical protein